MNGNSIHNSDGDGTVSRSEFDGPPDRFDILDKSGDGFLSEDESPNPNRSEIIEMLG